MRHRNPRSQQQQRRGDVQHYAQDTGAVDFFNVLTSAQMRATTEAHMPKYRERLYSPTVTLSMFMRQALEEDASCQKAVNGWAAQRAADGLTPMSVRTGAYCRARQRLPLAMVQALAREASRQLHELAIPAWSWRGRSVKLVDGTGVSMPDTVSSQARFPQPGSQAAGVGFPLACLGVVICLATGAVLEAAIGAQSGKGSGELALFGDLKTAFEAGDVMLADALYCNYFLVARMVDREVDVVMAQHGSRKTDFRRGKSLGKCDHIVKWSKPARPTWMTREEYQAFPSELTMRESHRNHRILVTTMVNPGEFSQDDLSQLYSKRWNVELDLRNIKTTMGMDVLHCQTPEMNEKELWVHLLAYNVIRLLMAQAANHAGVDPRSLSFKHTVQLWTEWVSRGLKATLDRALLFTLIAQSKVANRPGRVEPRKRKRRPKSYQWLKTPRSSARASVRRYGHAPRV